MRRLGALLVVAVVSLGLGLTVGGCGPSKGASKDKMEGGKMEGGKMEGGKMEGGKMEGGKMEGEKTEGGKMKSSSRLEHRNVSRPQFAELQRPGRPIVGPIWLS
jgi:hypothetical protein